MNDLFDLTGKTAVVTGAGSGLGQAYAHALAGAGAQLICADIDLDGARATASSITHKGCAAQAFLLDVTSPESVDAFARTVAGQYGSIDILVNNAGVASVPAMTHEVTIDDWDRVMAVNVRGTFLCSRAILPSMKSAQRGSIINIASFIGLVGIYPSFAISSAAYACSKAAVVGLTKQIAAEYASDGVRANVIAPGWHGGTNLGRARRASATPQDMKRHEDHINSSVPMRRRGKPSEMDALIIYLASDSSSYVTGQVFAHDGGLTAV